ncbi:hypothetical protein J4218_03010 [Candidatus Pacearchaeota archaeon]|nr:hypothetical protein [Candidatus Pacearchaeota archaeon]
MQEDDFHSATIYVWENGASIDISNMLSVLGGRLAPTMRELEIKMLIQPCVPLHITRDFKIYQVTGQMNEKNQRLKTTLSNSLAYIADHRSPGFSTVLLEERLAKLGLVLPDHELRFLPRTEQGAMPNYEKVSQVAAYLELRGQPSLEVLAVPGTNIEDEQLYASREIARKLGMPLEITSA